MIFSIEYSGNTIQTFVNDEIYFSGTLKKKFWKSNWVLLNKDGKKIASYKIKSKYFRFDFSLILSIEEFNQQLQLNYKSKKPHIDLKHQNNDYLIIFHIGKKISFLKNDIQFASLTKKTVSFGGSKTFIGSMTKEVNLTLALLLIFATILLDNINNFDGDSDFSIDLGSYHKELKPFDSSWTANN